MDLIHKFLNIVFPIVMFIIILVFLPPFWLYKLFKYLIIKPLSPSENLAGKVVLVTGASSGIGEHLAYEYAKKGARLALADRREERLRSVAAKAVEIGSPDVIISHADVSQIEDCKRIVAETIHHFGQLDHLVNNAGVSQMSLFEDGTQFSLIRSIMEINFWGSVNCTQFAIPHLRESKGKIVVISSAAAWYPTPRFSIYNASKTALISFFETLKAELGNDIGITIVTPGVVDSEMTTEEFRSKSGTSYIPAESTEGFAKAIVRGVCKGEMYLTEPYWYIIGFWVSVFFPELLQKCFHLAFVQCRGLKAKDS